jgi:hypothetical protein
MKGKLNMTDRNDGTKSSMDDCSGQVPGMTYVPWQIFTKAYDPRKALMAGTIFPELDKPFYGKCMMSGGGRGR